MSTMLQAGFSDPVFDSQGAFRVILDALSEPGTIRDLGVALTPPEGLAPASAIALLTLADFETPVFLSPALDAGQAGRWLTFHAGAPLVAAPGEAVFAVVSGGEGDPALAAFNPGEDLFPDRSTTILVQCASLEGGEAVTLFGPGIATSRVFAPQGPGPAFWDEAIANNALYPLGVDMLFIAGRAIAGLPRSTRIVKGRVG